MGNEKHLIFPYQIIFFCFVLMKIMIHYWGLEHCWFQTMFQPPPDRTRAVQDQDRHNHCDTPLGLCRQEKYLAERTSRALPAISSISLSRGEKEKVPSDCCGSLRNVRVKKHLSKLRAEKTFYLIRFFIPYHITIEFLAHHMKTPNIFSVKDRFLDYANHCCRTTWQFSPCHTLGKRDSANSLCNFP